MYLLRFISLVFILLMPYGVFAQTVYLDLGDPKSILALAPTLQGSKNQQKANLSMDQMKKEMEKNRRQGKRHSWSGLTKTACGAAITSPRPDRLLACARARIGSVTGMTNPQPSWKGAYIGRLKLAVGMLTAALVLQERGISANATIVQEIKNDLNCAVTILTTGVYLSLCHSVYSQYRDIFKQLNN